MIEDAAHHKNIYGSEKQNKRLSIVIPCYRNEQEIPALGLALKELNQNVKPSFEIEVVFVDDGSDDATRKALLTVHQSSDYRSKIVCLTGNFGSYAALHAGMSIASGDVVVQLHADLQEPPAHIPDMLSKWTKGSKLVIGQRVARNDGFWNDLFASMYHHLVKRFALDHIPSGGYDLVLMDREVVNEVVAISPHNVNLIYLVSSLKHPYETVPIERLARKSGLSQWSLSGKLKLVIDTMLAFSYWPVRLIRAVSFVFTFLTLFVVTSYLIVANATCLNKVLASISAIWAIITVWGVVLITEYLFRIHQKISGRPPYVIDHIID